MKKNLTVLFSVIILSAMIGLGLRVVFAQFTEPPTAPPGNNPLPIWVSLSNGDIYHTTGGNVGIGTTLPNRKLDIGNGSDGITIGQQADNTQTIQTYIDGQWANRATYAGRCCNDLFIQPDVGNVAIGTTTVSNIIGWPSSLNVNGQVRAVRYYDDDTSYYVDSNTTSRMSGIQINQLMFDSDADRRSGGDGALFRYNGQAAMSFDDWFYMYDSNNGNLRMSFNVDDQSVRAGIFYDINDTGYYVDPASASKFKDAKFDGNVGIGTTVSGYKLDVGGDIRSSGFVTAGSGLDVNNRIRILSGSRIITQNVSGTPANLIGTSGATDNLVQIGSNLLGNINFYGGNVSATGYIQGGVYAAWTVTSGYYNPGATPLYSDNTCRTVFDKSPWQAYGGIDIKLNPKGALIYTNEVYFKPLGTCSRYVTALKCGPGTAFVNLSSGAQFCVAN